MYLRKGLYKSVVEAFIVDCHTCICGNERILPAHPRVQIFLIFIGAVAVMLRETAAYMKNLDRICGLRQDHCRYA